MLTSTITGMQLFTYVHVDRNGLEFFPQSFIFHLVKSPFSPNGIPLLPSWSDLPHIAHHSSRFFTPCPALRPFPTMHTHLTFIHPSFNPTHVGFWQLVLFLFHFCHCCSGRWRAQFLPAFLENTTSILFQAHQPHSLSHWLSDNSNRAALDQSQNWRSQIDSMIDGNLEKLLWLHMVILLQPKVNLRKAMLAGFSADLGVPKVNSKWATF